MTDLAVAIPRVSSVKTRRSAKGRAAPVYALGHSTRELHRLSTQGRLLEPLARQIFRDAGIGPGMRVLDVGSGAGDVAFLAADLVGNTGEVIGMDRSEVALDLARARAKDRSLHNVSFQEGDPVEATFAQPFDAVVGRLVLMYYADPVAALRRLTLADRLCAENLANGGVVLSPSLIGAWSRV